MEKQKHTLSLGRVSPPVKESAKRFNGSLLGPPPGIMKLDDLAVDTDFNGLPLSPTNLTTNNKSFTKLSPRKETPAAGSKKTAVVNSQTGLKGAPKLAGLSSYEYSVDGNLRYHCSQPSESQIDPQIMERYKSTFHPNPNMAENS